MIFKLPAFANVLIWALALIQLALCGSPFSQKQQRILATLRDLAPVEQEAFYAYYEAYAFVSGPPLQRQRFVANIFAGPSNAQCSPQADQQTKIEKFSPKGSAAEEKLFKAVPRTKHENSRALLQSIVDDRYDLLPRLDQPRWENLPQKHRDVLVAFQSENEHIPIPLAVEKYDVVATSSRKLAAYNAVQAELAINPEYRKKIGKNQTPLYGNLVKVDGEGFLFSDFAYKGSGNYFEPDGTYMYYSTMSAKTYIASCRAAGQDPGNLKYILVEHVANEETQATMDEAFMLLQTKATGEQAKTFRAMVTQDPKKDNSIFHALSATPNLGFINRMLTEFLADFGPKRIQEIRILKTPQDKVFKYSILAILGKAFVKPSG